MAKAKKKEEGSDEVVIRVRFNDDGRKVFQISLTDMTNAEQIDTEEFFDRPLEEAIGSGWLLNSRKGLIWLAYLARRRREPEFTYQDAVASFDKIVEADEDSAPTEASMETGSPS